MDTYSVIAYIAAAICFALAALNIDTSRESLLALGLLAWVSVPMILAIRAY